MTGFGTRRGVVYLPRDEQYLEWQVGFKVGSEGRPVPGLSKDDEMFMRGYAAGYATTREQEPSDAGAS